VRERAIRAIAPEIPAPAPSVKSNSPTSTGKSACQDSYPKGVDATMFVEEKKMWIERCKVLFAEQDLAGCVDRGGAAALESGRVYREKVVKLTAAFQDEALKAQAFERLRALIEALLLAPDAGELTIYPRGEGEDIGFAGLGHKRQHRP
jgi:hypothetical protein